MEVSTTDGKKLDKEIMKKLQDLLHDINQYVKDFKFMTELPEEDVKDLKFVLKTHSKAKPKHIEGRYNLPSSNK